MYKRKTADIWELYGQYYGQWELLTAATSRAEHKADIRAYRENEPWTPLKSKKTREKICQE